MPENDKMLHANHISITLRKNIRNDVSEHEGWLCLGGTVEDSMKKNYQGFSTASQASKL